jgi:hypothetical protein
MGVEMKEIQCARRDQKYIQMFTDNLKGTDNLGDLDKDGEMIKCVLFSGKSALLGSSAQVTESLVCINDQELICYLSN